MRWKENKAYFKFARKITTNVFSTSYFPFKPKLFSSSQSKVTFVHKKKCSKKTSKKKINKSS